MASYPKIKVLLYEPDSALRTAMKDMLLSAGLTAVHDTGQLERVEEAIDQEQTDLIVCDTLSEQAAMCDLIRDMRLDKRGNNPFPVAIGLAADADQTHITKAINAGYDSIILKPLDFALIRRRVEHYMIKRKPFVVTSTYIGPDRRVQSRISANSGRLLDVPNPVLMMGDGSSRDALLERIRAARTQIDEEKVRSDAASIWWLAERISESCLPGGDATAGDALIEQMNRQVVAIEERMPRTTYAPVIDICRALQEVAVRLNKTSDTSNSAAIAELQNATSAAKRAFDKQLQADTDSVSVAETLEV